MKRFIESLCEQKFDERTDAELRKIKERLFLEVYRYVIPYENKDKRSD